MFIQNVVANVIVISHNRPNKIFPNFFVISMKLYHIYDKVKSVMIKYDFIFDDIEPLTSLWIGDDVAETADLARVADIAIDKVVPFVSMPVGVVKTFWPWVEGKSIKILARSRFDIDKNQDADDAVSGFAKNITTVFRNGADGVQVFVPCDKIVQFVDNICPIRNDLFFDRHLSIAIDIDDMGNLNWCDIFRAISKIEPDSILLFGKIEKFDPSSYFVGKIFDMLENWGPGVGLHLMFGKNMLRVTQVLRLVEKMRPELMKDIRVFVEK